jgi:hypothetical protein
MKTSKRLRSLIAIALISIIVASVAYALLSSTFTFQNTMSIKGVLVKLLYLADNTTVTTQAWGKLEPSQVVYFNGFALKNDGTENITLTFANTLNALVGTLTWEIEYYNTGPGWVWRSWEQAIADGIAYIPGHAGNPVRPGAYIGTRPTTPTELCTGQIRIKLVITASPPMGSQPFSMNVTGTEKV